MSQLPQPRDQLLALGVEPGGTLLVHTSFRPLGPVDGGPAGFIDALTDVLGPRGTLVMPSWSDGGLFDPRTSPVSSSLGIVAATFSFLPGVLRSDHPNAFAARGPNAAAILRDPLPLPPHVAESPVGRVHELDGQVLLAGVNHDANTTVHLAELLGGAPYRVPKECLVLRDGVPTRIPYGENDHCCARFQLVDEWMREAGLQSEGLVGAAPARLMRSRDVVECVVRRVREDACVFLHPRGTGCDECDEAWRSLG